MHNSFFDAQVFVEIHSGWLWSVSENAYNS